MDTFTAWQRQQNLTRSRRYLIGVLTSLRGLMISSQILGDFNEKVFVDRKQVLLDLFIDALSVRECKKARHLSVDFLANYLAVAFLKNLESDTRSQNPVLSEIEATATYIANELLENSIKFSDKTSKQPIQIGLCVFEREVFFVSKNSVNFNSLYRYNCFIQDLLCSEPGEFYFRQLEKGADRHSDSSQLGIISMIYDYYAKLGWKIETLTQKPEITEVTTMVQLTI